MREPLLYEERRNTMPCARHTWHTHRLCSAYNGAGLKKSKTHQLRPHAANSFVRVFVLFEQEARCIAAEQAEFAAEFARLRPVPAAKTASWSVPASTLYVIGPSRVTLSLRKRT